MAEKSGCCFAEGDHHFFCFLLFLLEICLLFGDRGIEQSTWEHGRPQTAAEAESDMATTTSGGDGEGWGAAWVGQNWPCYHESSQLVRIWYFSGANRGYPNRLWGCARVGGVLVWIFLCGCIVMYCLFQISILYVLDLCVHWFQGRGLSSGRAKCSTHALYSLNRSGTSVVTWVFRRWRSDRNSKRRRSKSAGSPTRFLRHPLNLPRKLHRQNLQESSSEILRRSCAGAQRRGR